MEKFSGLGPGSLGSVTSGCLLIFTIHQASSPALQLNHIEKGGTIVKDLSIRPHHVCQDTGFSVSDIHPN